MTVHKWLNEATEKLEKNNIGTARLDALVMLVHVTGHTKAWILAHPEHELAPAHSKKLSDWLDRRASHEPLSYILGFVEFYKQRFTVTRAVLVPRPESETMIDLLKKLAPAILKNDAGRVKTLLDVGTGSGALAITAKLEIPEIQVFGSDIDTAALRVARKNVAAHQVEVELIEQDLINPAAKQIYDIILANLPYVPDSHTINQAAMLEPKHAIFGGEDGLDLYRRLFEQIAALATRPRLVLTESLPFQHAELQAIANAYGYRQTAEEDFIQAFLPN